MRHVRAKARDARKRVALESGEREQRPERHSERQGREGAQITHFGHTRVLIRGGLRGGREAVTTACSRRGCGMILRRKVRADVEHLHEDVQHLHEDVQHLRARCNADRLPPGRGEGATDEHGAPGAFHGPPRWPQGRPEPC